MIYNIVGDLLKQDKVDIICHQTNCKGVMGAGIAFQIKRAYPEVFKLVRMAMVEDSARQIMWHLKRRLLRWQKPQPNIKRVSDFRIKLVVI